MSDAATTAKLQAALLKAFPLPEYATFFEVGDATGGRHSRWADAVSMACWPSRGLRISGFEIKASRSDWLREKKKPEKSVAIQRFCHHWLLITAPGVLLDGELPSTWGHMELAGGKLVPRVAPPLLTPDALEPSFVAALLRRAHQAGTELINAQVSNAVAEARARIDERVKSEVDRRMELNGKAMVAVSKFKEATGIDLTCWSGKEAGPDFALYRKFKQSLSYSGLERLAHQFRGFADQADALMGAMKDEGAAMLLDEEKAA
ncbi:hypothetical protein [Dyella amyloliquefaciens]|uniref:hypothetical protein n=1 Tax=Dyella amyloliquefaciens TaxID=1770545 RepID=UPI00102EBDD7|nr:hypothetical protein [Dyella amyloliquefaciens]